MLAHITPSVDRGAEVALSCAVVFRPQEVGQGLEWFFAAGQFGVFIPSRWFLVSFPDKQLEL